MVSAHTCSPANRRSQGRVWASEQEDRRQPRAEGRVGRWLGRAGWTLKEPQGGTGDIAKCPAVPGGVAGVGPGPASRTASRSRGPAAGPGPVGFLPR